MELVAAASIAQVHRARVLLQKICPVGHLPRERKWSEEKVHVNPHLYVLAVLAFEDISLDKAG